MISTQTDWVLKQVVHQMKKQIFIFARVKQFSATNASPLR